MKFSLSRALFSIAILVFALLVTLTLSTAQAHYRSDETNAIEKVMRAVVHIGSLNDSSTRIHTVGGGAVIASRRGATYVLTVKHNVSETNHLFIKTHEGKTYRVAYYTADAHRDLAILRVDTEDDVLSVAEIGDSRDLKVGQTVFALGFPTPRFIDNNAPTVSRGIVSALNRTLARKNIKRKEDSDKEILPTLGWSINYADNPDKQSPKMIYKIPMIQTDTMINSGSSGGPLITSSGKIVGIVRSMITNTGSNVGMNFAIPVSEAELLLTIAGVKEKK